MEKSYEEILRLLERLHMDAEGFVYRGSTDYLSRGKPPQRSAAVDDPDPAGSGSPGRRPALCSGNRSDYQCSGGLLLQEPDLVRKIVVVWLGGNTHHQPSTMEFNLMQDPDAFPGHFRQRRAVLVD